MLPSPESAFTLPRRRFVRLNDADGKVDLPKYTLRLRAEWDVELKTESSFSSSRRERSPGHHFAVDVRIPGKRNIVLRVPVSFRLPAGKMELRKHAVE